MAKNQVTLTFAGDSSSLERSFDKVGQGATDMGDSVGRGTRSLDAVGESADGAETRFTGLASGIDGVTTLMDDPSPQEFAQGLADIADGVANSLIPTLKQFGTTILANARTMVVSAAQHVAQAARIVASWVLMGIQATINAAKMAVAWLISLGPIGLVIAAVGAVIAILIALGVGFDDLKRWAMLAWDFILGAIKAVWNWVSENWPLLLAIITGPIGLAVLAITRNWDTIKNGFTAVKDWIGARVGDIVSFVTGIPGRIAGAAKSIGSTIIDGIKSGITGIGGFVGDIASSVKSAINNALHLPFTIHGPGPLPDFTIPSFHTGGTFQAPAGQREGLAMLLDGEKVTRPGASTGAPVVVNLYVQGSIRSDRDLIKLVRDELGRGGLGGLS